MSDVSDLKAEVLLLRQENAELRDRNAKLRKLASDMRWCLNDKCSWCQRFGRSCSTERDRQELGIEVTI